MAFDLSPCVGLTTPHPDPLVKLYTTLFELAPNHSIDGLKLNSESLSFFVDPGQRQSPILELSTPDLYAARPLLRALGFEELTWHGEGLLNLLSDPFGISWNVFQTLPKSTWPIINPNPPIILPKIALHLHESTKAAQFYANLLQQSATKTPSGWTIDSNHIRLVIEPGLPHGPAFYVDPNNSQDPQALIEFFGDKTTQTDDYGITWKLSPRPPSATAAIIN